MALWLIARSSQLDLQHKGQTMHKKSFIDYVMEFYGRGGLYPIAGITKAKVSQACKALNVRHYDSVDRESIRDYLLGANHVQN